MAELKPVLLGQTTRDLWNVISPIALVGWAVLVLVPRWKYTFQLVLVPPLIHAVLYAAVLLPIMLFPEPDAPIVNLMDMDSVKALFEDTDIFFCGWTHYLAFDLLVARGLAIDALVFCRVSNLQYYLLIVPCLLATLYVGPVGYLFYMMLRFAILSQQEPSTNAVKKGN